MQKIILTRLCSDKQEVKSFSASWNDVNDEEEQGVDLFSKGLVYLQSALLFTCLFYIFVCLFYL